MAVPGPEPRAPYRWMRPPPLPTLLSSAYAGSPAGRCGGPGSPQCRSGHQGRSWCWGSRWRSSWRSLQGDTAVTMWVLPPRHPTASPAQHALLERETEPREEKLHTPLATVEARAGSPVDNHGDGQFAGVSVIAGATCGSHCPPCPPLALTCPVDNASAWHLWSQRQSLPVPCAPKGWQAGVRRAGHGTRVWSHPPHRPPAWPTFAIALPPLASARRGAQATALLALRTPLADRTGQGAAWCLIHVWREDEPGSQGPCCPRVSLVTQSAGVGKAHLGHSGDYSQEEEDGDGLRIAGSVSRRTPGTPALRTSVPNAEGTC